MDIWCIGDINYFVSVLNGLAMLSNVGLFNDLVKLGLIIAVLVICFQAIFQAGTPGGIPWGRFIVAFIAFKFLFGSVTTVHVNDTYTLQSQDVDNVPYGVAVTGSILSKVAHEITENLEQAFSLPHMTENGFAGTLQTLTKGAKFINGVDSLYGGKITKTLVEYCNKCTSTGINKGELDINAIKMAPDAWNAMKWTSDIYYAMTWLPSDPPAGTLRSCTEAWGQIDNYLRGPLWTDLNRFLQAQICNEGVGTCDPVMIMQTALDSLATTEQDARNYMLSAVLLPVFEQGQVEFNSFMGKPEMAVIVGQAREQRNAQWQAEGSLFMNIARPMMAFFEGFLYAITPFMALLVAFVPAGLSLVGKYFMMFLWVQLWMPIMAILNHYAQMVAQQKLSVFINSDIPLTSIQGHLMGSSAITDWLGTAGILVASTPAISLALLFGGAITMTHLAGRLQHGDFINEKVAAPDVAHPAPILNMQPMLTAGDSYGLRSTGMEGAAGEINVSDTLQRAVASTQAEVRTDGLAYGTSLRETLSSGYSGVSGTSSGVTTHDGRSSMMSMGEAVTRGYAEKIGHAAQLSSDETQQFQGDLTTAMGGGGAAGLPGMAQGGVFGAGGKVSADFKGQLQSKYGQERGLRIAEAMENDRNLTGRHDLQAVMQDTLVRDAASGQMAQYLAKYDKTKIQDTQNAAKRLIDSEKKYSDAVQMSRSLGGGAKINTLQAAEIWKGMHGSARKYAGMIPGAHEGLNQEIEWAKLHLKTDESRAEWVGLARRLSHMAAKGDTGALKTLTGLREEAVGSPSIDLGDPGQYKGLASVNMQDQGKMVQEKAEGLAPMSEREFDSNMMGVKGRASGPMATKADVESNYLGHAGYISHKSEGELKQQMLENHRTTLKAQEDRLGPLKNTPHSMTQKASGALQALGNLGSAGWAGAKTELAKLKAIGRSLSDPEAPLPPGADPAKVWQNNRGAFFKSLEAQGKALGYTNGMETVYAQSMGNAFESALHEKFGLARGADVLGDPGQNERMAIASRAQFYRTKFGADDARELAQRDVALVKESGMYGGMDYAAPVAQVGAKLDQLEQHAQSSRKQIIMGAPGAARGVKPLRDEVAKNVHTYDDIIEREAHKHGVDPNLIRAVISQESEGKAGATSPKGAMGLMQLMPKTARMYGLKTPEDIKDPGQNIMAGTAHLAGLLRKYHGNEEMALAAYNAGEGNVHRYEKIKETREYVPQVLSNKDRFASVDTGKMAKDTAAIIPQGTKTTQEIEKATMVKFSK